MRSALRTLSLGLLAITAAACEDGLSFCTDRNDAGQCPDVPDFIFDASIDATTPPSDAGSDARPADATTADATVSIDASTDAGTDAGAQASYDVEDFCAAQYAVARAWRDKFDQCCGTLNNDQTKSRDELLANAFQYANAVMDSVASCVSGINGSLGPNLTYVPTAAVACADKFAAQFKAPPADCPQGGFPIESIESDIGHGIQDVTQIPECRAAFVGKLALNAQCTNTFTCQSGLRCIGSTGAKFCVQPRTNGMTCGESSECADGLQCVGSSASGAGGRVCRPVEEPVELNSNCERSTECRVGTLCFSTCVPPENTALCAQ